MAQLLRGDGSSFNVPGAAAGILRPVDPSIGDIALMGDNFVPVYVASEEGNDEYAVRSVSGRCYFEVTCRANGAAIAVGDDLSHAISNNGSTDHAEGTLMNANTAITGVTTISAIPGTSPVVVAGTLATNTTGDLTVYFP